VKQYLPYYGANETTNYDINSEEFKILRAASLACREPKAFAEEVRAGLHHAAVYGGDKQEVYSDDADKPDEP
jgi:hypothetical protein